MVEGSGTDADGRYQLLDDKVSRNRSRGFWNTLLAPFSWLKMLAYETHWSFVCGVLSVYGISQGLGKGFNRVATEFYMKDYLRVQPSESQVYQSIVKLPSFVKPLWGFFTDVIPIMGYRRRPYFIIAGILGMVSMVGIFSQEKLGVVPAVMLLMGWSVGMAIADVTIDACVAQNSNARPTLAADMQSLCGLSSSIGSLVGFFLSGILVHQLGPKGVYGLLSIPAGLIVLNGVALKEPRKSGVPYDQAKEKFLNSGRAMWRALKCPVVWRPCLYMFASVSLGCGIYEGMFYWFTDAKDGPRISQEMVGFIFAIGAIGALMGVILYQNFLKNYPFRELLFYTQFAFALIGLLDLLLVFRLNLKIGIPDSAFIVMDECVTQIMSKLKWMPLLVLSAKICPPGIEGTFFALLMSIDNVSVMLSTWGGGLVLRLLNVTRTEFGNLWLAIVIRAAMRLIPVALLFLIPEGHPGMYLLPDEVMHNAQPCRPDSENAQERLC